MSTRPLDAQTIVIGAGLAGLTSALHLAKRGVSVSLLEADPSVVGGRLQSSPPVSITQNGQTWSFPGEHGIHAMWGQYHNMRALLQREQLPVHLIPSRREAWILRQPGGKIQWAEGGSALRSSWIPAPFHYLALFIRPRFLQMLTLRDLASMFPLMTGLMLAIAYDPAVEGLHLKNLTLADYFKHWSPTLQSLFTGLARNFTSARPEEVPQSGFIAFLRFYTLLRRDAWVFHYFDRDAGTALIDPLVGRLEVAGGKLQTGARVTRLERDGTRWRAIWDGGSATADSVILALDAPASQKLLTDSPATDEQAQQLVWPRAIPTVVLRYWFNRVPTGMIARPEAGIFTGNFILDNYFWLHRFQQPFIEWHKATGGSAIECHIYGPPEILAEPDAVLLAKGLLELQRVWPALRNNVIQQSIRRNPATHTLFSVGASNEHLEVQTPWQGLWACGDWVRYPHASLYMERAVVTGLAAANGVLQLLNKEPWPIRNVDKPEILARGFEILLKWVRHHARVYNRRRRQVAHNS